LAQRSGKQAPRIASMGPVTQPNRMPQPNLKPKDLVGIPWRVAFALQADGWYLRQDIIWHKPNPMPESVTDRCTKAHEYLFLLSKSARYYFDAIVIHEPVQSGESDVRKMKEAKARIGGRHKTLDDPLSATTNIGQKRSVGNGETRNRRTVWEIATAPFAGAHFATFPPALIEPCIKAGCPEGGTVLDPFGGAGTTGLVADRLRRNAILIELNPAYADMARRRIRADAPLLAAADWPSRAHADSLRVRDRG
jgi:DNA modification methylase